ncbi:MAG: amidohydrolase [Firmicutes bacterium]|nr:amidohydrolase [Bacillota bacterium]
MRAIVGARIETITNGSIETGTVLIDNDGRIVAVGKQVKLPEGVERIDATGSWLLPGFIDAHNHSGIYEEGLGEPGGDDNEMTDPITPQLRAIDAVNPADEGLRDALRGGVTSVYITPGSGNVIGGQGSVLRTHGRTVEEMLLREFAGLKAAFGENPKRVYGQKKQMPMTRMGSAWLLRNAFTQAQLYLQKVERAGEDPEKRPDRDLKMEALGRVLRGEVPLRCHAHRADDIRTALRIRDEFGYRMVVDHGMEAHLLIDELLERDIPVAWGPGITARIKVELRGKTLRTPGLLAKAGVKVAIMTDHPVIPVDTIRLCAGLAVSEGMEESEALRALTLTPAEICGVADRVGSIEVGKEADLVLWDGHPFDWRSHVQTVLLQGKPVYERDHDGDRRG